MTPVSISSHTAEGLKSGKLAIGGGMTAVPSRSEMQWQELAGIVAGFHGHQITDDEADFLLWERSPFPFGTASEVAEAISASLHVESPPWPSVMTSRRSQPKRKP